MEEMEKSLTRLAKLPPDTEVLPGHGAKTTIGRELQ
jgi:glyoxylase-like metal-dependent hydrolase (beta-lactamase superfamily II)